VVDELTRRGLDERWFDVVAPAGASEQNEREVVVPSRNDLGAAAVVLGVANVSNCSSPPPCTDGVVLATPLPHREKTELRVCRGNACSAVTLAAPNPDHVKAALFGLDGELQGAVLVVAPDGLHDFAGGAGALDVEGLLSALRLDEEEPGAWAAFVRVEATAEQAQGETFRISARVAGKERVLVEGPASFLRRRNAPCFEAIVGTVPEPAPPHPCTRRTCRDHVRVVGDTGVSTVRVKVCTDGVCASGRVAGIGTRWLRMDDAKGDEISVHPVSDEGGRLALQVVSRNVVKITERRRIIYEVEEETGESLARGASELRFRGEFPNGEGCDAEPACRVAEVRF
jgi:hypothetical protein